MVSVASSNDYVEKSILHDWVEAETMQLDVVASWETLCETYKLLEFNDELSDPAKLEEFKWIIREMNKHLARSRKQLMKCEDLDSVETVLREMFTPSGDGYLTSRMTVAYQKLKQRWIQQMLLKLDMVREMMTEEELENGEPDGEF